MALTLWLLRRVSFRHWRLAPGQSALLVLILGLGVAAFLSIRLANRAAVSSFQDFTETLTGSSDWVIEAPSGSLPESVLGEVRRGLGARSVAMVPVVESTATLVEPGADASEPPSFSLLGIDVVGIANAAAARNRSDGFSAGAASPSRGWDPFKTGTLAWVPGGYSARESLPLLIDDRIVKVAVAGTIPATAGVPAPGNLIVMDLPELQRLTGKVGRVDRVEFVIGEGPGAPQLRSEVGALLTTMGEKGARWTVRSPGARRETAQTMTEAFQLNLTILSLIALLVGLYLIFQSLDGAVVRRRSEIAILRSLGVDESVILRSWLVEAAALGLAGGILGVGLGWVGAQGAVRAVGRTVNALYYATTVDAVSLKPSEVWLALGLGTFAGIIAGWWPAREAAQTPPAQILVRTGAPEPGAGLWRNPWGGVALVAAGVLLTRLPAVHLGESVRFPLAGYAAALAWIIGGGMIWASLLSTGGRLGGGIGRWLASSRVAMGHLSHPSGRHRLATAALLCAVGMCAGMAILVASFEKTVTGWVARSLTADLYLSSAGAMNASAENRVPQSTVTLLERTPGVAEVQSLAAYRVDLGHGAPAMLTGTPLARARVHSDFPWAEPPLSDAVFDPTRNETLCLVSESFSERFGLHRGDPLAIPTPTGRHPTTIAGVFADYGNERGSILVDLGPLRRWMADDSVTHVSIFVDKGVDPEALRLRIQKDHPGLRVFTNGNLKIEILRIFHQTFSITYALEVIGVFVAVVGLGLAMMSLLLDRRDELTTLRAIGFDRRQIAAAASFEGGAVALWAALGGLLLSVALGWLLIHVINKQSFGWTLQFSLPWALLLGLGVLVTLSGAAAAFAVGFWGSALAADREE